MIDERKIAYFTMEIGLNPMIPTYSGGLGILAGDTVKSLADLGIPAVCISILNREGYFYQRIDEGGNQIEEEVHWNPNQYLKKLEPTVTVTIEGREVTIQAWKFDVVGERGATIPVIFLDSDIEGNTEYDRSLCGKLYGGDRYYRFCQEVILGIGGVRMLEALQYTDIEKFHMNEGHAALATIELLHEYNMNQEEVKERCIFTTHTPVAAGHDSFEIDMVGRVLGDYYPWDTKLAEHDGKFNMTYLALNLSNYINGVAKKHKEISAQMFPGHEIHSITNGVHHTTWVTEHMGEAYSKHIPDWKHDPFSLRAVLSIPNEEIWKAHELNSKRLIDHINEHHNIGFDYDTFTIGFARRATSYKRAHLLFKDIEWLKAIAQRVGKIQLVFAGKAHANDGEGKGIIRMLHNMNKNLGPNIRMVYLENYDMYIAKLMVSGCDIWLNTPSRPMEASGTSGMKAAMNGVPQFSVLDGWWIEGHLEGVTGWAIGPRQCPQSNDDEDSKDLYEKLEHHILPTYYNDREAWVRIMKHAIALNSSFFHTHRMVQQYVTNAYFK